ncbi:hypothetical protein QQ045_027840 [Rhodiola kirilowii]
MEKCPHFTIRGAVAEFRKKDWRLNYPFPVHQELSPEQIHFLLPPLDTPKFKWWYCESCVRDLIGDDCPHQLISPELITTKESSTVDKLLIVNNSTAMIINAGASPRQPILDKHQMESEHSKTTAICHISDSSCLITEKPKVMFDLNETPTSETSDQPTLGIIHAPETRDLTFSDPECQITKIASAQKQHTGNTEEYGASYIAGSGCHSPEMEIIDSFEGASKKRRAPKYRTISELLKCTGENPENIQSNGTTEMVQNKKKGEQLKIQEKHGPEVTEKVSKNDDAGRNGTNRALDFSLPIEKNKFLRREDLQPSPVLFYKRKHRQFLVQDDTSATTFCDSLQRGAAVTQNETGNLLLPKKRRIFGDEVSETRRDINNFQKPKSVAIKRKILNSSSSQKIVKHDSTSPKDEQSLIPFVKHGKSPSTQSKKIVGKGVNQRKYGSQQPKKNCSDVISNASEEVSLIERPSLVGEELFLTDKPIQSPLVRSKEALARMHLLGVAAAETNDRETLSDTSISGAILPVSAIREEFINVYSETEYEGCAQAIVPTDYVSIDEAKELFMLGPENLPLRSHRILKTCCS